MPRALMQTSSINLRIFLDVFGEIINVASVCEIIGLWLCDVFSFFGADRFEGSA